MYNDNDSNHHAEGITNLSPNPSPRYRTTTTSQQNTELEEPRNECDAEPRRAHRQCTAHPKRLHRQMRPHQQAQGHREHAE